MTQPEFWEGLRWLFVLGMICVLAWLMMAIPDEGLINPPDFVNVLAGEAK